MKARSGREVALLLLFLFLFCLGLYAEDLRFGFGIRVF